MAGGAVHSKEIAYIAFISDSSYSCFIPGSFPYFIFSPRHSSLGVNSDDKVLER